MEAEHQFCRREGCTGDSLLEEGIRTGEFGGDEEKIPEIPPKIKDKIQKDRKRTEIRHDHGSRSEGIQAYPHGAVRCRSEGAPGVLGARADRERGPAQLRRAVCGYRELFCQIRVKNAGDGRPESRSVIYSVAKFEGTADHGAGDFAEMRFPGSEGAKGLHDRQGPHDLRRVLRRNAVSGDCIYPAEGAGTKTDEAPAKAPAVERRKDGRRDKAAPGGGDLRGVVL